MRTKKIKLIAITAILSCIAILFSSCSFNIIDIINGKFSDSNDSSGYIGLGDNDSEDNTVKVRRYIPEPLNQTTKETTTEPPTTEEPATVPTTTEKHEEPTTKKQWEPVTKVQAHEGYNDVVLGVIRGDYGNGADRKRKLRQEGFDPAVVQREVNRALGYEEEAVD